MSASQDKSQKPKFVSSNVFQLFKDGKSSQNSSSNQNSKSGGVSLPSPSKKVKSAVIKAGDLNKKPGDLPQVKEYAPVEMTGPKVVSRPDSIPVPSAPLLAIEGLKQNLKNLNELQSRLRFLLKEIEELTQD